MVVKKVLANKNDYIIVNKYKSIMIDTILNNINLIINGSPFSQLASYIPATQADQYRWTRYVEIAQRLKERIDPAWKIIYEDVILQTSNYLNEYERGKRQEHYVINAHLIKDLAIRQSLDRLLSLGSEMGQCRQILRNIEHNFKGYLNLQLDNTIYYNLGIIESYLFRTKGFLQDNIMTLGELNSTSILLDQITSKIEQNTPLNGFKETLEENIKATEIKTPMTKLFELLQSNDISLVSLKSQQNIVKEINEILDIEHKEGELTAGLHQIKKRFSQSEDFEFEHFQEKVEKQGKMKVLDEIVSEISAFTSGSLTKPLAWLDEKQLRLLHQSFHRKIEERKETTAGGSNHQQNKRVEELERQMEKLRKQHELLQLSQSQLNEHLLNNSNEMNKIKAKYTAIFTVLKKRVFELKTMKNQLHTELLSLRHFFEDQTISNCKEIQLSVNEGFDKMRKLLNLEKEREVQKVEERRRLEKTKLSNEYEETFNQLAQLKEKYYGDLTAKLCQSRLDISTSRIDNIETQDCAVGSFMLLDNSIICEESIGVGPDREEEEKERLTEEYIMAQITRHFQDQIDKLKKKIEEQEEVISILNTENGRSNEQLKEERARQELLSTELLSSKNIISQKQGYITNLLQSIKKLKAANLDYESAVKRLNQTANATSSHYPTLNNTNGSVPLFIPYHKILFQGDIFSEDNHHKETLIKHITNYMRIPIIKTHILHKFDPNNKTNFHLYIDNKKYLICVVKTKHAIIAGFYPGQLKEGVIMNEGGLLVSATNDQSYELIQKKNDSKINYRGMTYDPYYVIFGNAEMRVRSGEKRVFCNFGIQNSYFDYNSKPRNIEAFLNDQNREVEFEYCEFYQLTFQQPFPQLNSTSNLKSKY